MGIKKTFSCLNCNVTVTKQNASKYCSNQCQQDHKKANIIAEWKIDHTKGLKAGLRLKSTIREYIFKKYDSKCIECGWNKVNPTSNTIPLEIDHIDGDCSNNREENLRLICPNCHSLTSTYKALNAGNGHRNRLQYSGLIPVPPNVLPNQQIV